MTRPTRHPRAPRARQTPGGEAAETLTFFATADWGGQEAAPYVTPLQVAMAEAMGRVSASFHPKFVLSAGGNFLPAGLPGARAGRLGARAARPAELRSVAPGTQHHG